MLHASNGKESNYSQNAEENDRSNEILSNSVELAIVLNHLLEIGIY